VALRGWWDVKKDRCTPNSDIFLPIFKRNRLAEAVFFRLRVAGENPVFAVFSTDVVEEEISVSDFIFGTAAESDSAAVTQAVVYVAVGKCYRTQKNMLF